MFGVSVGIQIHYRKAKSKKVRNQNSWIPMVGTIKVLTSQVLMHVSKGDENAIDI